MGKINFTKALVNKTLVAEVAAAIIAALLVGGYFYFGSKNSGSVQTPIQTPSPNGTSSQGFFPSVNNNANPYEDVSKTNPVGKTNPFKDIRTNPFQ